MFVVLKENQVYFVNTMCDANILSIILQFPLSLPSNNGNNIDLILRVKVHMFTTNEKLRSKPAHTE